MNAIQPALSHADARKLVERAYTHWLGKTDTATAAAILAQCELALCYSVPPSDGVDAPPVNQPFSVKQAAAELGVSRETVYKLCAENALQHTRIGRRITIPQRHLEDYRESHRF